MLNLLGNRYILIILSLISVTMLIMVPRGYSLSYCVASMGIGILSMMNVILNSYNRYKSICQFNVLFIIILVITNYLYPVYFYSHDPNFSLFQLDFAEDAITKSTAIATLAITSFAMGSYESRRVPNFINIPYSNSLRIRNIEIIIVSLVAGYMIISSLGSMMVEHDDFSGQFTVTGRSYLKIIFIYLYYLIFKDVYRCSKKAYNFRTFIQICNKPILVISIITVLYYLLSGGRVTPMRIILLYVFCYYFFINKISTKTFFLAGIIGLFTMFLIGGLRNLWGDNQITYDMVETVTNVVNPLYYTRDLVINSRALYELVSYADSVGPTFGKTFIQDIVAIVPGLQSVVNRVLGISSVDISSAYLVTNMYFQGDTFLIGLGTNVIGDVYVAFKSIGVLVFFFVLGSIMRRLTFNAHRGNIISCLILCLIAMDVVFYTRSGFFAPLRNMLWIYCCFRIERR